MKKIMGLAALASVSATQLLAGGSYTVDVPEVGTTGSIAALAAVTAVGVMAWERRRKNK